MSFIDKLKSLFGIKTEKEKPKEEIIEDIKPGYCLLCNQAIVITDNTREVNGYLFHKRCFKKIKRGVSDGQSMEEIVQKANKND